MTPDVNALVAASRLAHPHHAMARAWLEWAVADAGEGAEFTLMPMVAASFLRLVTSPKIRLIDRRRRIGAPTDQWCAPGGIVSRTPHR
jgi:predicted nucleic acid-binding protein